MLLQLFYTHIVAINIAIGQHHGWVVLVHDLTGDFTDQTGVCTMGHRKRLSQLVQGLAAYRAIWVFGSSVLFVTLSVGCELKATSSRLLYTSHTTLMELVNPIAGRIRGFDGRQPCL